jgi:hypothetical protein
MLRKLVTLVVAVLTCAGIGILGTATSAQASHNPYNYDVYNKVDGAHNFYVHCHSLNAGTTTGYYDNTISPYPGSGGNPYYTAGGLCAYFSVGYDRRVLYQSRSTGLKYWTKCGEDEWGLNVGYGFAQIGGNVDLLHVAVKPEAPANVC